MCNLSVLMSRVLRRAKTPLEQRYERPKSDNAKVPLDVTAYPMRTVKAPRGVTIIGGANVYAAKLATATYTD